MTQDDLQELIANKVEESLILDYKAAASLANTDSVKKEITKDVSAMANSAGGRIIYGIKEPAERELRHLPERIDPVDRRQFTKEWLEHVISNIRPRISGLVITPVPLASSATDVAYVVDVPMSTTAHQATDLRYYRRYNFESVAMADHEIRDILGRASHPKIAIQLSITERILTIHPRLPIGPQEPRREPDAYLRVMASNQSSLLARFAVAFVHLPAFLLPQDSSDDYNISRMRGIDYASFNFSNTRRDVVGVESNPLLGGRAIYGPSWFDPLLPKLTRELSTITLRPDVRRFRSEDTVLLWDAYADNAPPEEGEARLSDIAFESE